MGENGDRGSGHCGEAHRRLGALPADLQERLDTVMRGPVEAALLLDAVMSVGRGLDLPQVLRRIVEAAVVVVDAEYGALGAVGEETRLAQFLAVGVTGEQREAIGALPEGHGILGELIRHSEPLRLVELSEHPSSYGFPPDHPPMHSFLGVPVRVRDKVFGNLYLTEKRGGRAFDAEDETVLSILAVAAGWAIENARLYAETRDRQRWQEANNEIVGALLSGADEGHVLRMIVDHSSHILAADLGVLALPAADDHGGDDTDDPVLVVEHGQSTDVVLGEQFRDLLEGGERDDRDDLVGHQVSHLDVLHGGTSLRLTAIHSDAMPEAVQEP